jgi:hypothetical protein
MDAAGDDADEHSDTDDAPVYARPPNVLRN